MYYNNRAVERDEAISYWEPQRIIVDNCPIIGRLTLKYGVEITSFKMQQYDTHGKVNRVRNRRSLKWQDRKSGSSLRHMITILLM